MCQVLVRTRGLAPKTHGNIIQFFLRSISNITFCFYYQVFCSKREGSGHMIPYEGSPACHVLIHSAELQHSDSTMLKEEPWWLTYMWVW